MDFKAWKIEYKFGRSAGVGAELRKKASGRMPGQSVVAGRRPVIGGSRGSACMSGAANGAERGGE